MHACVPVCAYARTSLWYVLGWLCFTSFALLEPEYLNSSIHACMYLCAHVCVCVAFCATVMNIVFLLQDIAGLVTTIYDTLGSSIKVPHYGSKTIKVKLTVSPDQRKKDVAQDAVPAGGDGMPNDNNLKCSGTCPGPGGPSAHQGSANHRVKFKRDLNVTIRESHMPRRLHRRRRCSGSGNVPVSEDKYANSCSSSCRSGVSENNDDGAADISEDDNDDDLAPEDLPVDRELGSQHSTLKAGQGR